MSTVLDREIVRDPILDGPARSHIHSWEEPELVGLCGARLLGIRAHPEMPQCEECNEIAEARGIHAHY